MPKHDDLYAAVMVAIERLYSDTSVSQEDTLCSLNCIKDDLDILITNIENDLNL